MKCIFVFFIFLLAFSSVAFGAVEIIESKSAKKDSVESKSANLDSINSNNMESKKDSKENIESNLDSISTQSQQNIAKDSKNEYFIFNDLQDIFTPYSKLESPKSFSKIKTSFVESLFIYAPQKTQKNTQETQIAKQNIESKLPQTQITQTLQKLQDHNIDVKLLAPKCLDSKFSIKKDSNFELDEVLKGLAKKCNFSIQYYKEKKEKLAKDNTLNIENKDLKFILELLLADEFYEIKPHRLIVRDSDMLTYEINYVSSTRMAQSNTDVLFSQDQNYNAGYMGNYTGYGGSFITQQTQGYGYNNNLNFTPSNAQGLSGYLDNLSLRNQLRNQMTYQNTQFGKSGTKIYSIDEINFWADIESKLNILLDSKKGDRFMLDKGAGLVSVWTTRAKMEDVAIFLANLESKMNLQVSIDVEILSLVHYNTSNIGIDWQEIFNVLNPLNSNLSINFGGASSFSLTNSSVNLNSIFNLLKTYGSLRSLSNPKIMALNNQPAIISVGSVLRYSQSLVFQANNTNNTIQNTSMQYPSVFSGILLDITPSISKDSIILRINPSVTKTKDPEIENTSTALNSPPNLSTNHLSTIVKLKDGERVIIGGLLNNISQNANQAIPGIGEAKGLDRIFGKKSNITRNEELIIIITPHIIRD